MATRDYDFIGFTFGGKHSIDDFGIYRTSDGSRYNDNLTPQMSDKTADVPGGDGQYFFSTNYKNRQFSISVAFDNLSEEQYREMRQWLNGKEIQELIFDEAPYKVYSAKVTGTPNIKFICFVENESRVYKGEGMVQFTCYYPFAHTPILTKSNQDGRSLGSYREADYPTKQEWENNALLPAQHLDGNNYGDIPANFVVTIPNLLSKQGDKIKVGNLEITLLEDSISELEWDSKTGLVTGFDSASQKRRVVRVSGQSYGGIPVGGIDSDQIYYDSTDQKKYFYTNKTYRTYDGREYIDSTSQILIEYNYWYY